MKRNAFLDKGIVIGYCFFSDPQFKKCQKYIHSGQKQFYVTKQIEDIYKKKRDDIVESHGKAIREHLLDIKSEYSGKLSKSDISEIRSNIDQYANPCWRLLRDFYEGKEGVHVRVVEKKLRDLSRDLESRPDSRREQLDPLMRGWSRFSTYPDLHEKLAELKRDDGEDFYVTLDAHDVAVALNDYTELATTNPADFGEGGHKQDILEHTEIDDIQIVSVRRGS